MLTWRGAATAATITGGKEISRSDSGPRVSLQLNSLSMKLEQQGTGSGRDVLHWFGGVGLVGWWRGGKVVGIAGRSTP